MELLVTSSRLNTFSFSQVSKRPTIIKDLIFNCSRKGEKTQLRNRGAVGQHLFLGNLCSVGWIQPLLLFWLQKQHSALFVLLPVTLLRNGEWRGMAVIPINPVITGSRTTSPVYPLIPPATETSGSISVETGVNRRGQKCEYTSQIHSLPNIFRRHAYY